MAEVALKDPVFVKIKDIQPGKHCYNVFAKVIKIEQSDRVNKVGEKVAVVEGVVADETSSANFKFIGDHAQHIKVGAVIAIRNGRSNVSSERIVLELDKFGKISLETDVAIPKPNVTDNISSTVWEKKAPVHRHK